MSRASQLTELNRFSPDQNGVFSNGQERRFEYSDGDAAEQQLREILATASDLGSESAELTAQIVDWPTEYHLSPARSNLLRCLNLAGVNNVLELGCGCGAITRYLGEQAGIHVDAIEGSPIRATLAASRCRDLANVSISTGNFNELSFPDNHYDLVLFIGVTEYAGRFSERDTDQQALQDLLALAKRACREDGLVVIAIENRTGLKYMLGANEDHYGVPYVGLDNYPESTGIRTYTQSEWQKEIQQASFEAARFAYPFPDYKVPSLIIRDATDIAGQELSRALGKTRSRDYLAPFNPGCSEPRLWQAVVEANALGQLSNSFLIALGQDQQRVDQLMNFDLLEYPQTAPVYDSDRVSAARPNNDASERKIRQLRAELLALEEHANKLQHKVDLMTRSRGWSLLNFFRRLFGKSTIK